MTIRQKRQLIQNLAASIVEQLDQIAEVGAERKPYALTEEEYTWQIKARDMARLLSEIDINAKG